MRSYFALVALAASVLGQRLSVISPAPGSTIPSGTPFTVGLEQAVAQGILQQVSVTIAVTPCFDVCDNPSEWGLGTVLYSGAFNPQSNSSNPEAGLHQNFSFTLPDGWPTGGNVLSVAHLVNIGAGLSSGFDYTDVQFTVV